MPYRPYPGLTDDQLKKLLKKMEKTDSKVEFIKQLLTEAGVDMQKDDVVKLMTKVLENEPDVRTFDYGRLWINVQIPQKCNYVQ